MRAKRHKSGSLSLQFEASLAPIPLDNLDIFPQTNPGSAKDGYIEYTAAVEHTEAPTVREQKCEEL